METRDIVIIVLSILLVASIITIIVIALAKKKRSATAATLPLTILSVITPTNFSMDSTNYLTNLNSIVSACQSQYSTAQISLDTELMQAINDRNYQVPNLTDKSDPSKNVNFYWCNSAVYQKSADKMYYLGFPSNPSSNGHQICGNGLSVIIPYPKMTNSNSLNDIVTCFGTQPPASCPDTNTLAPQISGYWISVYSNDTPSTIQNNLQKALSSINQNFFVGIAYSS
jgi:hypothetical protein